MNSLTSAIRRYSRIAAIVLLPFLALICGIHPARADGVNQALGSGQIVYGTISSTGVDQYTFYAGSGRYFLSLWESAGDSTTTWASFKVYNPNGSGGPGPWCDGGYDNGVDSGIYTNIGTYTVKIENCYGGAVPAASYGLQIIAVPGATSTPAGWAGGAMRNGETYSGNISLGEQDVWTLDAATGESFTVAVAKTSGGSGYCPMYKLVYPDGAASGWVGACTSTSQGFWARGGTHYVVVENTYTGNDTGGYTLQVTGASDLPIQGKGDGSTCVNCEAAKKSMTAGAQPGAHSGGVVSNGATATETSP
jgi:hypothetical protein